MATQRRKRRMSSVSLWLQRLKRRKNTNHLDNLAMASSGAGGGGGGAGACPLGGELGAGGPVTKPNPLVIAAATAGVYAATLF